MLDTFFLFSTWSNSGSHWDSLRKRPSVQVSKHSGSASSPLSLGFKRRENSGTPEHQKEFNNTLELTENPQRTWSYKGHINSFFWWVQCKRIRSRWITSAFKYTCAGELQQRKCLDPCISKGWSTPSRLGCFAESQTWASSPVPINNWAIQLLDGYFPFWFCFIWYAHKASGW